MAKEMIYTSPLVERYASREMVTLFSPRNRYLTWRKVWISLAEAQMELGAPISKEDIEVLKKKADLIDFSRVAQLEKIYKHDVIAHLKHFAELAGESGKVLHWGATSAFVTDNSDVILIKDALLIIKKRISHLLYYLAKKAEQYKNIATLGYTHFQPAQPTTVGKRFVLWAQDFLNDYLDLSDLIKNLKCRGAKGTTGTQASYLELFDGDREKVVALDRLVAKKIGFEEPFLLTGQTYPRKQDVVVFSLIARIAESAHKVATDIRLLQAVGEIREPFGKNQIGSSAMPYKRNPVKSERICSLARRILTDLLGFYITSANQWLERSLDDSAIRRLIIPDSLLTLDAILILLINVIKDLEVDCNNIKKRLEQNLLFLVTEKLIIKAVKKGADRVKVHEKIRNAVFKGDSLKDLVEDPEFPLNAEDIEEIVDFSELVGLAPYQVDIFLDKLKEFLEEPCEIPTVEY